MPGGPAIDDDKRVGTQFLPYQRAIINDDAQKVLIEKSVRIGITYTMAFRQVRERLRHGGDYLFVSRSESTSIEFIRDAARFCDLYQASSNILTSGHDKLVSDVRVGYIKFTNGGRILSFSSNPDATRGLGGDLGWDEAAFSQQPDQLYAAAAPRTAWGNQMAIWSSHNGDLTLFNELVEEAKNDIGGWSYHRIDIYQAIEQGLVEKINQVSGTTYTRESFLQECREKSRDPAIFAQEFEVLPIGGRNPLVDPAIVDECCDMEPILRDHLDAQDVANRFGDPTAPGYEKRVEAYLSQIFGKLRDTPARYRMGFDVAASGGGDLTVLWLDELQVDESRQEKLKCRACLSIRSENWTFIETCVAWFMANLSDIQATGDETGLGRQICWSMATRFPGRFAGLNFGTKKSELMTRLMDQLTAGEKRLPGREKDIVTDVKALRKEWKGAKWVFTEGRNPLNNASHCDYAIASALASDAATRTSGFFSIAI